MESQLTIAHGNFTSSMALLNCGDTRLKVPLYFVEYLKVLSKMCFYFVVFLKALSLVLYLSWGVPKDSVQGALLFCGIP